MKKAFKEMVEKILESRPVDPPNIPDIDLYMDQVLTFMDTKLTGYKRSPKDKIYTKTMINNYAKAGLILPPEKKKYSRENMMLLLLIYRLKQILSIQDIADLFALFGQENKSTDNTGLIQETYQIFLETDQNSREDFCAMCGREAEMISALVSQTASGHDKPKLEWLLMALFLANQADLQRRLAEQIIDKHFKRQ